jgi:hypothetical protein
MIAVISSSVNIIVILVDLVEEDISVGCDIIGGRAIVDRVLKSTREELVSIVVVATLTLDVIWPSLLVIVNIVDLGWVNRVVIESKVLTKRSFESSIVA